MATPDASRPFEVRRLVATVDLNQFQLFWWKK